MKPPHRIVPFSSAVITVAFILVLYGIGEVLAPATRILVSEQTPEGQLDLALFQKKGPKAV